MKFQFMANCLCPECGQPMLNNQAQKRMVCIEPGCPNNGKFFKLPEIEAEPIEVKDF